MNLEKMQIHFFTFDADGNSVLWKEFTKGDYDATMLERARRKISGVLAKRR